MRRLAVITLLLFFSLPLLSPLLALSAGSASNLPACCRSHGAHQCMLQAHLRQAPSRGLILSGTHRTCPAFPIALPSTQHGASHPPIAALTFAASLSHPAQRAQTEARARIALDRSRQKRGPPLRLL